MPDLTPKPLESSPIVLDAHQKNIIRLNLKNISETLLGIPYRIAKTEEEKADMLGKWIDMSKLPPNLDCSGLTHGVYRKCGIKLPHGSLNQFNFTVAVNAPAVGDLAFFGKEGNINKVYHVGMVFDNDFIIEARDYDKGRDFKTGEVILRGRMFWERYKPNFLGYRSHPKLL